MTNPFLSRHFAPLSGELEKQPVEVIGKLPQGLSGCFIRNGPNPKYPPSSDYHYFDGDGMLHAIHFVDGTASYTRRFVETQGLEEEIAVGKSVFGGLLGPLPPGDQQKNVANTSILNFANHCLALWERGKPYEINPETLQTIGEYDFDGQLTHSFTAHPKVDRDTGELFCFGYQTLQAPFLSYSVFNHAGKKIHTTEINLPYGVMMHDFAITSEYAVFLDLPFIFSPSNLRSKKPLGNFDKKGHARIGVLPRYSPGADIRWFDVEPAYVFHVVNAFEKDSTIILDVLRYIDLDMPIHPPTEHPINHEALLRTSTNDPIAYRYKLDLATGKVSESELLNLPCEFPSINPSKMGLPYRYFYAACLTRDTLLPEGTGWLKYDLQTDAMFVHEHRVSCVGGEAIFVPDPMGENEDDGWLLGFINDDQTEQGECVIVDARDPAGLPLARVILPERMPHGLHGAWITRSNGNE